MNVIVLLIDSLRRDYLGCYGNDWVRTPNFDRLAARSTVFEHAYVGSYPCMPARRDLWTGRLEFPFRGWGPLETVDRDLPSLLGGAGRTSMLITDHYHLWQRGSGNYHFSFSGYEFIRGQENDAWITDPDVPVTYPAAPEKLARHARAGSWERYSRNISRRRGEEDYFAPQVLSRAAEWLEANRGQKDFLLMLDCFDPHEPFDPPQHYIDMYAPNYRGEKVLWPTYGRCGLPPEELAYVRALYAAEVSMVDHWVGRMLDKLEELGLDQNTTVIVTTDHGHMFGEHGVIGKPSAHQADSNLYQELAHIPLMIYAPGAAPKRVSGLAQLIDVYPTVCELLGVPVPEGIHGRSLLPAVAGHGATGAGAGRTGRPLAIYGRFGEAVNVTDGEWTLFLWPQGEANEPLFWYGTQPPTRARATGPVEAGELGWRFPVAVARGQSRSALYHLPTDPGQQVDRYESEPQVVARLVAALKDYLDEIGAPPELQTRLGI